MIDIARSNQGVVAIVISDHNATTVLCLSALLLPTSVFSPEDGAATNGEPDRTVVGDAGAVLLSRAAPSGPSPEPSPSESLAVATLPGRPLPVMLGPALGVASDPSTPASA